MCFLPDASFAKVRHPRRLGTRIVDVLGTVEGPGEPQSPDSWYRTPGSSASSSISLASLPLGSSTTHTGRENLTVHRPSDCIVAGPSKRIPQLAGSILVT